VTALLVVIAVGLGLIVGSFLNVVIHRVPLGESVVRPRSACPGCGVPIAARDNVPVVSWLLLRGRARCCGTPISPRYLLVELGTGVAFGTLAGVMGLVAELPAFGYLAAISIALAVIDLRVHRLPDVIVLPSYPVGALLLLVPTVVDRDPGAALRALAGAAALFVLYGTLWVVKPGGMGLGDVKLSGVLGMYLGWLSWAHLVVGAFLGFLVGGLVGAVLIANGRTGWKSKIPYGPSMLAGVWVAVAFARPVADWYLRMTGISG
jgi:leader peptidase (prepilin peptidase)/N-methyltransferase